MLKTVLRLTIMYLVATGNGSGYPERGIGERGTFFVFSTHIDKLSITMMKYPKLTSRILGLCFFIVLTLSYLELTYRLGERLRSYVFIPALVIGFVFYTKIKQTLFVKKEMSLEEFNSAVYEPGPDMPKEFIERHKLYSYAREERVTYTLRHTESEYPTKDTYIRRLENEIAVLWSCLAIVVILTVLSFIVAIV